VHNPTGPAQSPIRKRLIATRPAGLEPATFGFEARYLKIVSLVIARAYNTPKKALTNQLTNERSKTVENGTFAHLGSNRGYPYARLLPAKQETMP